MEPRRYAYIDALRGYAILMVIAVHASQYFSDLPFQFLANQGARGVQLFFVASAMTLCMSWKARHDGAGPFYLRRFFRIAPMFYLAVAFFLWLRGLAPNNYAPDGLGLRHALMTLTFTNGFLPDTITSLVPGSWSIADEVMFYAAFPVLVAALDRVRFATAVLIVAALTLGCFSATALMALAGNEISEEAWQFVWRNFLFLWFPQQLPCFLFGMLAFRWMIVGGEVQWPRTLVLASLAAMAIIAVFPRWPHIGGALLPAQYGFAFALFALGLSQWQPWWLVNPIIGWIGKVSYSGYLVHLALIAAVPMRLGGYFATFALLIAVTIAISTLTYFCIEEPFNRLGRNLARLWLSRSYCEQPSSASGAPVGANVEGRPAA